jgi:hypothetical protein
LYAKNEDIEFLEEQLKSNETINELHLCNVFKDIKGNNMIEKGVKALGKIMQRKSNILTLDLCNSDNKYIAHNNIETEGIHELLNANNSLQDLNLG